MKDKVYLVWYRDTDIYRSDSLWGVYKDKFAAIAKAKEAARDSIGLRIKPDEVESLEPGSNLYKRVIECRYVAHDAKLVAAYWPDYSLFTVEETPVQ